MRARLVGVATMLALGGAATTASAQPSPKRKVVVLEYRAGSSALPQISDRVATRLRKLTSLTVIDPTSARQRIDHLDDKVVRCQGDAACLGTIGQQLGADEVVLVGVSELGDVILTLQRIVVRGRQVQNRIAESLATSDQPTDDILAQYLGRLLPGSDFIRFGLIKVVANMSGARVRLDGNERGITPIDPLRVRAPATYDVKVEKTGYVPFSASIAVPPDGEVSVKAELSQRGGSAWYQKWWVLAIAGAAVVGATTAAIYVGTRPGDKIPVGGTLD